jgi:hypothetical protein
MGVPPVLSGRAGRPSHFPCVNYLIRDPKLNTETGSPAGPTIIVEKLTVLLDAQQLIVRASRIVCRCPFKPVLKLVLHSISGLYEG